MNIETFHKLLAAMMERNVSDVHFQVGYPPLFRLNGELVEVKYRPLDPKDPAALASYINQPRGPHQL